MLDQTVIELLRAYQLEPVGEVRFDAQRSTYKFDCDGDKPGSRKGWCIVYPHPGRFVVVFGHWSRAGLEGLTKVIFLEGGRAAGPAVDFDALAAQAAQAQAKRQAEHAAAQEAAAQRALALFGLATRGDAVTHAYLDHKQLKANGLRVHEGKLLVPLIDACGKLWSVQSIPAKIGAAKLYLKDGRTAGCYCPLNRASDAPPFTIIIAEGWATGAAIAQDDTVSARCFAAMSAGNPPIVAKALHAKYPEADILIAADNDFETERKRGFNPGLEQGRIAALAVGGHLLMPPANYNDFSDARLAGYTFAQAVEIELDHTPATPVAPLQQEAIA